MNTPPHVTTLKAPCAFCAEVELKIKLHPREREKWLKLLAAHKGEQPARQPELELEAK